MPNNEAPSAVFKTQHMPSLEGEPPTDSLKFPSTRLAFDFHKVEFLKKAYSPICNSPISASRVNLRKLVNCLSTKAGRDKSFFSDSYYTWLALFQDTFVFEWTVDVTKSISIICLIYLLEQLADSLKYPFGDRFMPCEDRLLLIGLKKFGIGNWDTIQNQMVPSKTARQLQTRFKNMTCRRADDNPFKSFFNELVKPLSRVEEELLYRVPDRPFSSITVGRAKIQQGF